ncbi:MAG: molybdate ABC transporter substrate-binding protein [Comamonadaceae bacterium]|nr:MAG: molybdate ABC transporter substrate-binding protein [Comamonadaceae bacterium]
MAAPMQRLAAAFTAATGHTAVVVLGSTGKFYAQVRNGAPFEVLLAADDATPARLEQEGFAVQGTRFTYATGRLALWSARDGVVADGAMLLRQPPAGRLAIADPRVAPYGAAAMEAMTRLGVLAAWRPHLVQGENIGQAYQFAATGNAALGFVALAQVMEDGRIARGSAWTVPLDLHAPLRQDAIVLKPGWWHCRWCCRRRCWASTCCSRSARRAGAASSPRRSGSACCRSPSAACWWARCCTRCRSACSRCATRSRPSAGGHWRPPPPCAPGRSTASSTWPCRWHAAASCRRRS